ncbi:MAG: BLUF domain-containing protein [Pseudomonadota bacterium]
MRRVIYTSHASERFKEGDLFRLVSASSRYNGQVGVTGFLLYANGRFLQLLEGPDDQVTQLFALIKSDVRHDRCEIVLDEQIAANLFANWSMRRVPKSSGGEVLSYLRERIETEMPQSVADCIECFLAELRTVSIS